MDENNGYREGVHEGFNLWFSIIMDMTKIRSYFHMVLSSRSLIPNINPIINYSPRTVSLKICKRLEIPNVNEDWISEDLLLVHRMKAT